MEQPKPKFKPDWVAYLLVILVVAIAVISLYVLLLPNTESIYLNIMHDI